MGLEVVRVATLLLLLLELLLLILLLIVVLLDDTDDDGGGTGVIVARLLLKLVILLVLLLLESTGADTGVMFTTCLRSFPTTGPLPLATSNVVAGGTVAGVMDTGGVSLDGGSVVGVTLINGGEGARAGFLRVGGEGDDVGLSRQITWGLTDPEDGGETALLTPKADPFDEPII